MRAPFAFAAAACAWLGTLLALWALVRVDEEGSRGYETLIPAVVVVVVAVAVVDAVAGAALAAFAVGAVPDGLAVTAVVALGLTGPVAAGATYYLPLLGALLGGIALAAGKPLPPPAPDDDRMDRPLPRDQ